MEETLIEKAKRLGIKPAGTPASSENLLQKAQRLGIKPANPVAVPKDNGGLLGILAASPTVQTVAKNVNTDINNIITDTKNQLVSNVKEADNASRNADGSINPLKMGVAVPTQALKGVVNIGAGVVKAAGAGISDIFNGFIPQKVKDVYSKETEIFLNDVKQAWDAPAATPEEQKGKDQIHGFVDALVKTAKDNPEVTKTIGDAITLVLGAQGLEGGVNVLKSGTSKVLSQGPKVATAISEGVDGVITNIKNKVTTAAPNELQSIADTISPKMTLKEVRLAESQGRIIKGDEPTLLRGGTPDQVLTSDKVYEATQTIAREIPGAAKMTEPELYTALEGRTADMAKTLKPQMEAVRVKPNSLKSHIEKWNETKARQILEADATEEPNIIKIQKQFDSRLKKVLDGEATLDDVWQERIAYDNSVPANVKNATSLSDSRLQFKKEMWLQNREVLNNIINDAESGLGAKSRVAFKDMSNMYNAKANLLSKAKFVVKPEPSKVLQWVRDNPYVKAAVKATGLGSALRLVD